jgi:hypothetical protein
LFFNYNVRAFVVLVHGTQLLVRKDRERAVFRKSSFTIALEDVIGTIAPAITVISLRRYVVLVGTKCQSARGQRFKYQAQLVGTSSGNRHGQESQA